MFTKYSLTLSFLFTLFFIPNQNITNVNEVILRRIDDLELQIGLMKGGSPYSFLGEGSKEVLDLVEKNLDKWGGVCGKVNNGENNIVRIRDPRIVPKYFQLIACNKSIINAE